MADQRLKGMKVAIIASDDFEQVEMTEPREALRNAGAITFLIAPHAGQVQAFQHDRKGDAFDVEMTLDEAAPDDFDGVMLPGGVINADRIRQVRRAQDFVVRIDEQGKPVAVICHAPWLLISAGLVSGRTMTSYYTLKDDIRNAGGQWLDREGVWDRNWISSRNPRDLPVFNRLMVELFSSYWQAAGKRREAA